MIAYEMRTPDHHQFMDLLQMSGQASATEQFKDSLYTVSAYDGEELIACGSLTSAGERLETKLLIVRPDYASRQVDGNIMKLLTAEIKRRKQKQLSHAAS
jgi:hypothetical protein